MAEKTLFERIRDGEIPSEKIYEDDDCFVIRDINPQAPTHVLIIPNDPITRLSETGPEKEALLGRLIRAAAGVAARLNLSTGYRIVINNGPDGGESVPHLHIHLLGGRQMTWPPG